MDSYSDMNSIYTVSRILFIRSHSRSSICTSVHRTTEDAYSHASYYFFLHQHSAESSNYYSNIGVWILHLQILPMHHLIP